MLETDNVVVLSLCVGVPCPFYPVVEDIILALCARLL